ncbi:MAG: dockerin type I domain-containing protein [Tepidisphaeraceae bacterium]
MTAKFLSRGSGSATITLDQDVTLNRMELGGVAYSIVPGATSKSITFAGTNARSFDVTGGNHVIGVPVVMSKSADVSVVAGASLRIDNVLTATGKVVTKVGAGTLELRKQQGGGLVASEGTTRFISDGDVTRLSSLSIAATGATLDLGPSTVIVDGVSSYATLKADILAGRIMTSSTDPRGAVGYAKASDVLGGTFPTLFAGETISADSVLLRYTFRGDINLDRTVNFIDLLTLANHYGQPGDWYAGDFTGDGQVNFADLLQLAQSYGASVPTALSASFEFALSQWVIPEPSLLSTLGLTTLVLRRRAGTRALGEPRSAQRTQSSQREFIQVREVVLI